MARFLSAHSMAAIRIRTGERDATGARPANRLISNRMIFAQIYLIILLLLSIGGLAYYLRKPRTADEIAINVLAAGAPALLVLAYLIPDLLMHRASLLALFAITIATNWLSGYWYHGELQEDAGEEFEITAGDMYTGVAVMLAPAFWFGGLALLRG